MLGPLQRLRDYLGPGDFWGAVIAVAAFAAAFIAVAVAIVRSLL